jgi:RNA polymerase sigma factor (sigma-70 family)
MEIMKRVPAKAGVLRKQNKKYYGSDNYINITDAELITKAIAGCSDSFIELCKRNDNLYYKICQKYLPVLKSLGYDEREILDDKNFIIFEAAKKFNATKGASFNTWLGNCTRFYLLNKINDKKHIKSVITDEEARSEFDSMSASNYNAEEKKVEFDKIFKALNSNNKIKKIFELRYDQAKNKKTTWDEIAKELKISVETVVGLHKKGLKLLKKEITHNNLDIFSKDI